MTELENLQIWQLGIELTKKIYTTTLSFPKSEIFGLTSQMRRAASSIPSNIAEGKGRGTAKDFAHFLHNARGSLYELKTHITVTKEIGLLTTEDHDDLEKLIINLSRKIASMISHLRNQTKK